MRRRFHTLDVFTDTRLAGNPLAVVLDCEELDTAGMAAIAREFNLSETVFVLPPRDPVNTARLRIFTPSSELPFAGHPTIGTAVLIAQLRAPEMMGRALALVLEEGVGAVQCTVTLARQGASRAGFDLPRLPERLGFNGSRAALAAALDLRPEEIGFDAHEPSIWSAGNPFCFVPVASLAAIGRARSGAGLAAAVGDARGAYLYTRETVDAANTVHARMFGTGVGIVEDPATGAAAAAFAGLAAFFERPGDGEHTITIEQGYEMGRPSLIAVGMSIADGQLRAATIGGSALQVCEGTIEA